MAKCPKCGKECSEPQGYSGNAVWYYCTKCLEGFKVLFKDSLEKEVKE
jgi:DNA-directed RNA polymerase subunit RPC12/RpoP